MHASTPADDGVTAPILAGGRARRLGGTDKSALTIDGQPSVERQLAALRHVTDEIVVVGGDPARFAGPGVRAVPEAIEGCGAAGGIYSALAASARPRTLVVACDMPFLSVPLLRRLVQPFPSPDVDAVVPRTHQGLQPLCAVYAARCAEPLRERIARGLLRAADLRDSVRVEEIGPEELATHDPDGLMFANVNTPHDYARAKDLVGRLPGSRAATGDRITDART